MPAVAASTSSLNASGCHHTADHTFTYSAASTIPARCPTSGPIVICPESGRARGSGWESRKTDSRLHHGLVMDESLWQEARDPVLADSHPILHRRRTTPNIPSPDGPGRRGSWTRGCFSSMDRWGHERGHKTPTGPQSLR